MCTIRSHTWKHGARNTLNEGVSTGVRSTVNLECERVEGVVGDHDGPFRVVERDLGPASAASVAATPTRSRYLAGGGRGPTPGPGGMLEAMTFAAVTK